MTKLNQIQNALLELDGGRFQKLADSYLFKKGYQQINSPGSVAGSDKVRKGTPDTFFRLPSGKDVLVEYTTQKTAVFSKIKEDLNKCLDVMRSGVPIEEIIFCHTSTLSPIEEHNLAIECMKYGVNLNIFGIDKISQDLYQKYPVLARDFLEIEVDTGQIIPPDDFISTYSKNKLATRLDTNFRFRETEIEQVLVGLENSNLFIVSGRPGIGKSRLALECCKRFKEARPDYKIQCIYNRGLDLYEDLRVHFSEPGHFLILVDDANRASRFDYIVQLLQDQHEDQRIKVIVTVRDYALAKVLDSASSQGDAPAIELPLLDDDQIKQLVRDEFSILNPHYLDRIAYISKGNPRLAIMAAEVAKRDNKFESIIDVTALYDKYFASIRFDLNELSDKKLLKVAGIVAFFQSVDRSNKEMTDAIETAFEISSETFWEAARKLHDLEVFDMYGNDVVKTSDQVLSTYLLYLSFFKENVLDFSVLLDNFFPRYRHHMVDSLNSVLNAFNTNTIKEALRKHVDKTWALLKKADDNVGLLHLMEVFWFLMPTDTLLYIKSQIEVADPKQFDPSKIEFKANPWIPSPSLIGVLSSFNYSDDANFRIALNLLFDYIAKRQDELPYLLHLLTDKFGFKHGSYLVGFRVQRAVVDVLWKFTNDGQNELYSRTFLAVAETYLQINFRTTESKGRHAFSMINFQLSPTTELFELRRTIWSRVFHLYQISSFRKSSLNVIYSYCTSNHSESVRDIAAQDAIEVLQFINLELDPKKYSHCYTVHKYLDLLSSCGVPFDQATEDRFTNEAYKLSKLLFFDRSERRNLGLSHDEYQQLKKRQIDDNFVGYSLDDYKYFFSICLEIHSVMVQCRNDYQIQKETVDILLALADREQDLYIEVLEYYLKLDDPFYLTSIPRSFRLIEKLVEICKAERSYEILSRPNNPMKQSWLFCYYIVLSPREITNERLNQLYSLYEEAKGTELPRTLDFLLKYHKIDESVIVRVTEIILGKVAADSSYAYALTSLFNKYTDINNKIVDIFANNKDLLKRAYFAVLKNERHMDYDGQTFSRILDLEPDFISEYINQIYKKEETSGLQDDTRDYAFLWMRDDYKEQISRAIEQIFEYEQSAYRYMYTDLNIFFTLRDNGEKHSEVRERQNRFLECLIARQYRNSDFMRFIFGVIANFPAERRCKFIDLFLERNKCIEDFKKLALEPNSSGWTGSAVPTLQKRVDYFESILSRLDEVQLLQHKQYVEGIIQGIRIQIEWEKKRDFIGD
ncbi:MAG: hypothetical protein AB9879_00510 [Methanothrix sp.]